MTNTRLFTAVLVAGILAAGVAAAAESDRAARRVGGSRPAWRKVKADDGRKVPARTYSNWSRADRLGSRSYGAAWDDLGWSHLLGAPDGYGYPYSYYGGPFYAVGVAGDSLGAVTLGALGTSH